MFADWEPNELAVAARAELTAITPSVGRYFAAGTEEQQPQHSPNGSELHWG